ncbi:unnamed protein product [Rhizoctonia solani]|uniref:Uncharacterized protein n=1 Tax=Rhizoctonia solani TaxID=456999 RepID=A0A8H2XP53_9AGAM|nr:unnamed protein product [Rhizoctonia solani]
MSLCTGARMSRRGLELNVELDRLRTTESGAIVGGVEGDDRRVVYLQAADSCSEVGRGTPTKVMIYSMGKNFSQLPHTPTYLVPIEFASFASSMIKDVVVGSMHEVVAQVNADKIRVLANYSRV